MPHTHRSPWMRSLFGTVGLYLALLLLPTAGSAQDSVWPGGADAPGPFAGIDGLRWGADRAAITALWGEPDRVDEVAEGTATALLYADTTVAGERANVGFLMHPERGLVRGQVLFPYRGGEDCWRLFTKVRELVSASAPDRDPKVRIDRGPEDLSFCTAFQLGAAEARALWTDPGSGGRIALMLDLEAGAARLSYESPAFQGMVPSDTASARP